jgi:RimJ/RimL family protein N-acetyltransferase
MSMDATRSTAWREAPTLRGRHVSLEPLAMDHVDALSAAAADGALWELHYTTVPRPEETATYVATAMRARDAGEGMPFVVRDADGAVVGSTRYYRLDPGTPRLLIGYTWYARRVQRTALNSEAKRLLLAHAFEALGCIGVGFETSIANLASRKAIARLGAVQEGILRNHLRHKDGSVRDTVCFSITDAEWRDVRAKLDGFLAEQADG